ncbi:hypothetical protein LPLM1_00099 [Listeria phage LPML1]|nr:hypothetical protein LPLM1_00099 [Listeria phage LPML1]
MEDNFHLMYERICKEWFPNGLPKSAEEPVKRFAFEMYLEGVEYVITTVSNKD